MFFQETASRRPVLHVKDAAPRGVRKQASAGVFSRIQSQASRQAPGRTFASLRAASSVRQGSGQWRLSLARSAQTARTSSVLTAAARHGSPADRTPSPQATATAVTARESGTRPSASRNQ